METRPQALLALSLKGDEENLLRQALQFCEKSQMDLQLCHVLRESSVYTYDGAYFPETLIPEAIRQHMLEDAESKLSQLIDRINPKGTCRYYVKIGSLESAIEEVVHDKQISLLITGKGETYQSFFTRIASNLVSLSKITSIPLLIIPHHHQKTLGRNPKILIADSLSEKTKHALNSSILLAQMVKNARIHHVHVCDEFTENLSLVEPHEMDEIFQVLRDSHGDNQVFLRLIDERLKEKMQERWDHQQQQNTNSGNYRNVLLYGEVSEQLKTYIQEQQIDLFITGGHFNSILQSIIFANQLPLSDQISGNLPTLIVPQNYQGEEHLGNHDGAELEDPTPLLVSLNGSK